MRLVGIKAVVRERGKRWLRGVLGVGLGVALAWGFTGCHKSSAQDASVNAADSSDPANVNMVPVNDSQQPAQVLAQNDQYQNQQQGEEYPQQQGAPIVRQVAGQPADASYDNGQYPDQQAGDIYDADLTDAQASDPPPELPEYDQPPAPDPDYLWTPGYWAWGPGGYYWVPGCWVDAPYEGALWTPGYWGFYGGYYRFHHGFWGLHIGFYGGINYGYGYGGYGYDGGYWRGNHFYYNTAVNRVNVNVIRNVYVHNVTVNNGGNRVSFNGGRGGISARPRPAEIAVLQERRTPPMASQQQVQREASQNKQQFFSANKGRPAVAVAARPVAADRGPQQALPRVNAPVGQQGRGNNARPGQVQGPGAGQNGRPQVGRPGPAAAPITRQAPAQQNRPEQVRPQPQQQVRPAPQQQVRPQPQQQIRPQEQARPVPQQQARPQYQPQPRPQEQARPQPQQQARPQEQARPQPQQQARPQQAPRPQPQARPAAPPHQEAPRSEPHQDDRPHR